MDAFEGGKMFAMGKDGEHDELCVFEVILEDKL